MGWYNGVHDAAHYYDEPAADEHLHATPPAAHSIAAPSLDYPVDYHGYAAGLAQPDWSFDHMPPTAAPDAGYHSYPPGPAQPDRSFENTRPIAEYHGHPTDPAHPSWNYGNIPPMAVPGSSGGQGHALRKRKSEDDLPAASEKRLRLNAPPTGGSSYTPAQGTQHDPLKIESSPEPETRGTTSIEAINPARSAGSLKEAGLYFQRPDSSARKVKYYAVAGGKVPGIYTHWPDADYQTKKVKPSTHQHFKTEEAAWAYLEEHRAVVEASFDRLIGHSEAPGREQAPSYPPQFRLSANMAQRTQSSPPLQYTHSPPTPPSERSIPSERDHLSLHSQDAYHQPVAYPSVPQSTIQDDVTAEPELILSPEQQRVVNLILGGNNVFYTGSAGCGKSTILKAFVKKLKEQGKRVRIVAPTNLAALNVNGQTTWNFAGWTPDSMKKPLDKLMQAAHGNEVYERFINTDVLVIDEISMVENLQFERLNEIMKASIGDAKGGGPFGGVQIIVTGDFCQLSPVKPFKYCIGCGWELIPDNKFSPKQHKCENRFCKEDVFYDVDKWAFRSKAWQECNFKHVNLTEIHRQHDKKFISILQRIRTDGVILDNHAKILLNHESKTEDAIQLFARRDDVDRVNRQNIEKLPSEARIYKCTDHFNLKDHHRNDKTIEKNTRLADDDSGTLHALKEHRYEVNVLLKESMRVVLQANLDPDAGLVNGSQGAIIGFEPYDRNRLPQKSESRSDPGMPGVQSLRGAHANYFEQQIKFYAKENKNKPWPIVKFDNGLTRTIYADCTANEFGTEEPYSLLSRTQIPLMAGYAITVHKSQGMTLDRVIVDLSRAFEPSQIYVALSRARSLYGLKVIGLPKRRLGGANAQVKEFFEMYLSKKPSTSQM